MKKPIQERWQFPLLLIASALIGAFFGVMYERHRWQEWVNFAKLTLPAADGKMVHAVQLAVYGPDGKLLLQTTNDIQDKPDPE